jgi:altronate hydrolase
MTAADSSATRSRMETLLRQNPDHAYCRLLCPRRLEANTGYHALLVPTFETGRLAGLGRAADEIAQVFATRSAWEDYTGRNRGSMDNNPSPGNKKGGLTTILEKSLGAAAKGGTTPLTGVYKYAEPVTAKGFTFMDSPGYDPASVTGQIASGCNLVCFTTGRGSAFGAKPSPSMKVATNTEMYARMTEDMDINAGRILTDGATVEEVGREIYGMWLRMASGEKSKSEAQGLGDYEFVPWQIGAVM